MAQASIKAGGKTFYVQAKGLKVGSRGKVVAPQEAMSDLTKGEKRHIRKTLHKMGRIDLVQASL